MRNYEVCCHVTGCASGTIKAKNKKEAMKLVKENINNMVYFANLELDHVSEVKMLDIIPI